MRKSRCVRRSSAQVLILIVIAILCLGLVPTTRAQPTSGGSSNGLIIYDYKARPPPDPPKWPCPADSIPQHRGPVAAAGHAAFNFNNVTDFDDLCDGPYPIRGTLKGVERELRSRALCSRALSEVHSDFELYAASWLSCARLRADPLTVDELQSGPDGGATHRREVERCAAEFSNVYDPEMEWNICDKRLHIPFWVWDSVEITDSVDGREALCSAKPGKLTMTPEHVLANISLPDENVRKEDAKIWYGSSNDVDLDTIHELCRYETGIKSSGVFEPQIAWDHLLDVTAQQACSEAVTNILRGYHYNRHRPPACRLLVNYGKARFVRYDERVQLVRLCANAQNALRSWDRKAIVHRITSENTTTKGDCISHPFFIPPEKGLAGFKDRWDPLWDYYTWDEPWQCTGPCNDSSTECREQYVGDLDDRLAGFRHSSELRPVLEAVEHAASFVHQRETIGQTAHSMCLHEQDSSCAIWWDASSGAPADPRHSERDGLALQELPAAAAADKLFCTTRIRDIFDDDDDLGEPWRPPQDMTVYVRPDPDRCIADACEVWECAPARREHAVLREQRLLKLRWLRAQRYWDAQAAARGKSLSVMAPPGRRHAPATEERVSASAWQKVLGFWQ